jgi:uncharacterized protein with FMN-binding domain
LLCLVCLLHADEIELLKGGKMRGKVLKETDKFIAIELSEDGATMSMNLPTKNIHAVTIGGKRRVINEKAAAPVRKPVVRRTRKPKEKKREKPGNGNGNGQLTRSKAEVEMLIKKAGATRPEWWDSVNLSPPATLPMNWATRGKGTNANLSAYVHQKKVRGSANDWKHVVKILHKTLDVNKGKQSEELRSWSELGFFYGILLEDPARGAYCFRQGGSLFPELATCYQKLGNESMAKAQIAKVKPSSQMYFNSRIANVWAAVGDLQGALAFAKTFTRFGRADLVNLAMGNIYRAKGKYKEAQTYYQKGLDANPKRDGLRPSDRLKDGLEAVKALQKGDLSRIADGTHTGTSTGWSGNVVVEITIKAGKITAAKVTECRDTWPTNTRTYLPKRIVEQQGITGLDAVSGATVTSDAIINAAGKALGNAIR